MAHSVFGGGTLEQCCVTLAAVDINSELSNYAQQGWELVTVLPDGYTGYRCFFKRFITKPAGFNEVGTAAGI